MNFTKTIEPRNSNEPANACSNGCKNQSKDVAQTSFNTNHESYRSQQSQGGC